jgi:peptidyl-prolyl cis-trans isomerase SurA
MRIPILQSLRKIFMVLPLLLPVLILGRIDCAYAQQVLDRVVAVVGGEAILLSDLQARTQFYAVQNRIDVKTPGLQARVLDFMINDKLVLAKAVEDSITVSDDELRQQLDARIKELVQQYGSESRVEELYGMSINRMRREFRDDMKKELLKSKLQSTKFGNTTVTRREVEEFFEAYRDSFPTIPEEVDLSHIYITPKPSAAAKRATFERAKVILDSIKAGGDFAALAKRYSEDLGSASHGGDLGWARRGDFVKEFEEAAFALKEGQLSGVVETSLGFHIIQMLERRGEAVHVRQILVKMERTQADDDSTIAFLKGLKARIEAGEKFSDLAKKYSEDEESASLGGDLGTPSLNQLQPEFLATVKALSPGQISEPTKVTFSKGYGYHIVLLRKRIPEHKISLQGDWKRVEQLALGYKRNNEYARWLEELRKSIFWESRL